MSGLLDVPIQVAFSVGLLVLSALFALLLTGYGIYSADWASEIEKLSRLQTMTESDLTMIGVVAVSCLSAILSTSFIKPKTPVNV